MEQKVDKAAWSRRELFEFFGGVSNPYYMVTFRQDVTKLYHYVKQHGLPGFKVKTSRSSSIRR